jgi:hypothetical protein
MVTKPHKSEYQNQERNGNEQLPIAYLMKSLYVLLHQRGVFVHGNLSFLPLICSYSTPRYIWELEHQSDWPLSGGVAKEKADSWD